MAFMLMLDWRAIEDFNTSKFSLISYLLVRGGGHRLCRRGFNRRVFLNLCRRGFNRRVFLSLYRRGFNRRVFLLPLPVTYH